jgi:hypothetical protein
MTIREDNNNYNFELVGIIEFDFPSSLNWVQNRISANAIWDTLIIDPNQWVQNFQQIMEGNNRLFYDDINDGDFICY